MSLREQKNERNFNLLVAAFIAGMIVSSFLAESGSFEPLATWLNIAMIISGTAMLILKFYLYPSLPRRRNASSMLLLIFLVVNLVSTLLNYRYNLAKNLLYLFYMAVLFLMVYESSSPRSLHYKKKVFYGFAITVVTILAGLNFISLLTFALGISYRVNPNYWIGFDTSTNRLWGIYNPNVGSTLSILSIGLSLYLWGKIEKRIYKVLLSINMFLQFTYIVLAQSRANMIAFSLMLFIVLFTYFYNRSVHKIEELAQAEPDRNNYSAAKHNSLAQAVIFSLLLVVLVSILVDPFRDLLVYVPNSIGREARLEETGSNDPIMREIYTNNFLQDGYKGQKYIYKKNSLKRTQSSTLGDDSRGRKMFWRKTIESIEDSPVLGISYDGLITEVRKAAPDEIVSEQIRVGGVHSAFFSTLGASGFLGLTIIILYAITYNLDILSAIYHDYKYKHSLNWNVMVAYAVVLAYAVIDLAESRILYCISFNTVVYWFISGVLHDYALAGEYELSEDESSETVQAALYDRF